MCCHCMTRREFCAMTAMGAAGGVLGLPAALTGGQAQPIEPWDPDNPFLVTGRPVRVQPVLIHARFGRREKTSWRSWSRIIDDQAAAEEMERIGRELKALAARADFPLELLPTAKVTSPQQGQKVQEGDFDVVLLYAATEGGGLYKASIAKALDRDTIVFLRHKSGPTYYFYECFGRHMAAERTPEAAKKNSARSHGGVTLDDAVVDDYDEVLWRLRALYGLKNFLFLGQRIVALGGTQGKWDGKAPQVARDKYLLNIVEVTYDELAGRLKAALAAEGASDVGFRLALLAGRERLHSRVLRLLAEMANQGYLPAETPKAD